MDSQVSSVLSSQLSDDFRWDSEHYKPEYLKLDELLKHLNAQLWEELEGDFIIGPFGSAFTVDKYVERSPYRYIRGKDVKPFFLKDNDNAYMPEEDYKRLKKYAIQEDDLLVSVVGTLGNVALVNDQVGQAIFSCKSTIYRSKLIDPYYLTAYLNSSIGQAYLQRKARGAVQLGLNLPDLKSIPIYLPLEGEQNAIGHLVRESWQKMMESKTLYEDAEKLLLEALGLDKLDLSPQLSYTAMLDEVIAAESFSPGYFHPEKQMILQSLEEMDGEPVSFHFESIYDLINPQQAVTPEPVYNYDLTDALRYFLDDDGEMTFTTDLGSTKKRFRTQDIVVSRLRSYLKEIAIIATPPQFACVGSSEFFVFRSKSNQVTPELLLVYLRSEPVQKILKWCQTGTNHPRFEEKEISNLKIPKQIIAVQEEITQLILRGIQAHREAKQLLETAKQRVEQMILGE
ncbi:MAG: restriction endonuclease subunit S [Chloroflexi bacterium]|nr:restriction endonuclease subunit S [Chloroflexota bacterium]